MADQECPKCGARFAVADAWAKGALSLLSAGPAVRDMATQVRCPTCGHVFADSEVRYLHSSGAKALIVVLALMAAGILIWAVY